MNSEYDGIDDERRTLLKTIAAGATVGGAAAAGVGPAAAQSTDLSGFFSNTGNAGEVTDKTGQDEVTVEVGTDGNGSAFGFGPAVVRVDPGTNVVWEWTGKGGQHNVVADDGSFESEYYSSSGDTFEHAFESAGVTKYYCAPHEMMGMKGAVVVGDTQVSLGGSGGTAAPGGESGSGDGGGAGDGGGRASTRTTATGSGT
jgi:halocyanin-like protein